MTQEDKQLLVKDLSARLLYGVIVNAQYKDGEGWKTKDRKILGLYEDGEVYLDCVYTTIDYIKPYLRPLSSITEEEAEEFYDFSDKLFKYKASEKIWGEVVDWMNEHHFDYRGLIDKGLALEAPKGMYKYV